MARGVRGYNHHQRPLLLYANPRGHCVHSSLKKRTKSREGLGKSTHSMRAVHTFPPHAKSYLPTTIVL